MIITETMASHNRIIVCKGIIMAIFQPIVLIHNISTGWMRTKGRKKVIPKMFNI
jgi:hypothetical protein